MLDRDLQHPLITHILRTGEPLKVKYPERDDVEIVEVDITQIIIERSKKVTNDY